MSLVAHLPLPYPLTAYVSVSPKIHAGIVRLATFFLGMYNSQPDIHCAFCSSCIHDFIWNEQANKTYIIFELRDEERERCQSWEQTVLQHTVVSTIRQPGGGVTVYWHAAPQYNHLIRRLLSFFSLVILILWL